ncbi:arsenic resistance protein [Microbacterium karelineae]|uniref:arsenic resistance protein n=1 Tax=Microbacterium karelineae TaxID=2654283 RepID=UPI0012EA4DDD|nr:arsenic resistance protein [Microbacterium karelineae]
MRAPVDFLDRHQTALCLLALVVGAAVGILTPSAAHPLELAVEPVLGLLLYATFLGVPFSQIRRAMRDGRFVATILVLNFVVVPVVVLALARIVAHDRALLVGVLFVLLAPCVDYVIAFTGMAGGAQDRLLAAMPILLIGQMIVLPLALWAMTGREVVAAIEPAPFLRALLLLIVIPLAAAALTQAASRTRAGRRLRDAVTAAMVPLMMLTLALVVASQIHGIGAHLGALALAILVHVLFAAVMVPLGILAGRVARIDVAGRRALVFSGVTRNSLVVLPLALALPEALALVPLVIVSQTLVELVTMVILVRIVPRVVRHHA